ncbi:hypothetical protein PspLS_08220 [Pyricularia sp. CBS 133598]|nr:hypothetical protein PspLS_08220 [Pyricularia sp. CBS 133598]
MAANTNRFSTYTTASVDSKDGEKKKDMWNSMLESVASGKRLPEKNLLVLGGTVETQRSFLETLSSDFRRTLDTDHIPPVANHFALGNTYYDVLDADQEDILARITLYSLTKPSASFSSLLKPLLTPQTIPNTLVVILLDWSHPWLWMRQLRDWILLLRTVLVSLSIEAKDAMEEVMIGWRDRGRGGASTNLDGSGVATAAMAGDGGAGSDSVALPLGPGEWEDALGLPLSVVCQNADKIDSLEKRQGWKEEQFDVVMQFMRTVLLKHGASLIYTSTSVPSQLPSLIHSSLGITSLLKRQPLKHNVIDRDKIVVPPNWDSWGKIRVLRDGFDVEMVSEGWSIDLDQPFPRESARTPNGDGLHEGVEFSDSESDDGARQSEDDQVEGSAVVLYEQKIENPSAAAQQHAALEDRSGRRMEVDTEDHQAFLEKQYPVLDEFRKTLQKEEDEEAATKSKRSQLQGDGPASRGYGGSHGHDDYGHSPIGGVLGDQIGPVQFNMGGIQMDTDAAFQSIQRLTERQHAHEPEPEPDVDVEVDEGPTDPDRMQAFFAGLIQRGMAKSGGT